MSEDWCEATKERFEARRNFIDNWFAVEPHAHAIANAEQRIIEA